MLTMPQGSSDTVSIVGIDPGTQNLGVAVLLINIVSFKIVYSEAWTIVGSRLAGKDSWAEELHGARFSRIAALEQNLLNIFRHFRPLEIACESPFYSQRHPQAFGALTEVICGVRNAVINYDQWKYLHLIDPPSVKQAVGAKGNAQKEIIKEKILQLTELCYSGNIPIQFLDEHSIDALAVGYSCYKTLKEKLCLG